MIDLAASPFLRLAFGLVLAVAGLCLAAGLLALLVALADRLWRRRSVPRATVLPLFKFGLEKLKKTDVERN